MEPFIKTYGDRHLQHPMDVAVIIPTILRRSLAETLKSIFAQQFSGHIHILIGIDQMLGDISMLDETCAMCPSHCTVQVYWPGYSTAMRNGGLTPPSDGGALRCVLTHMANARYVAYLDDDNWWSSDHLAQMRKAITGFDWAFTLRWFVHPIVRRPICVDTWESVGPGRGVYNRTFGGYVDPNCLMFDKLNCRHAPLYWNFPLAEDPGSADRNMFHHLNANHRSNGTGKATVYYAMNASDKLHAERVKIMGHAYTRVGEMTPLQH